MKIKKIEIQNFRSYYGSNTFDIGEGLTLIVGSNGDGKTTFYSALEWVFKTDGTAKVDIGLISKKRSEELRINESDNVRVAVTYEHNSCFKTLEKCFRFTKNKEENITPSNFTFYLIIQNGVERQNVDGARFDYDFTPEVRKYSMFKGESELDIFKKDDALKILIDTFSDIRAFDAYSLFMKYASGEAEKVYRKVQDNDDKNSKKISRLNVDLEKERCAIAGIEKELRQKEEEVSNISDLLKSLEQSKESSKLLKAVKRRIEVLTEKRARKQALIQENYSIDLLDNLWILLGFTPIAEEYNQKVATADKMRRKIEKDYILTKGAEKVIEGMKSNFVPLPVHVPGPEVMQEMLDEEICKICGRPAKKHSPEWEFMFKKLEAFKESLEVSEDEEEIEPCYENDFIGELQKRSTILNDNLREVTRIRHSIFEAIAFNNRLHNDIMKIDSNLEQEYEEKKRILAQADGLTEEMLEANFENLTNWVEQERVGRNRIDALEKDKSNHVDELEKIQAELDKLAEGTTAAIYARIYTMMRLIANAFESAKESNKKTLITNIEDEANRFLSKLNINDFKGTVRILEKQSGGADIILKNDDDARIMHPNEALKTTFLMSVLFAIAKIAEQKKETEYPLLFDAPTSSFTDAKEQDFFKIIGKLGKQVIIVTKSFLRTTADGFSVLDSDKAMNVDGVVYHIEKKRPFDDKRLGTIQTVITKIK